MKTKDGRVFNAASIYPKGHPQNPMSQEEIKEKFPKLALYTLGEEQAKMIIHQIFNLDKLAKIEELVSFFIK